MKRYILLNSIITSNLNHVNETLLKKFKNIFCNFSSKKPPGFSSLEIKSNSQKFRIIIKKIFSYDTFNYLLCFKNIK